jgi:hypothetical protein
MQRNKYIEYINTGDDELEKAISYFLDEKIILDNCNPQCLVDLDFYLRGPHYGYMDHKCLFDIAQKAIDIFLDAPVGYKDSFTELDSQLSRLIRSCLYAPDNYSYLPDFTNISLEKAYKKFKENENPTNVSRFLFLVRLTENIEYIDMVKKYLNSKNPIEKKAAEDTLKTLNEEIEHRKFIEYIRNLGS